MKSNRNNHKESPEQHRERVAMLGNRFGEKRVESKKNYSRKAKHKKNNWE